MTRETALALYRRCLARGPKRLRQRHGVEMESAFLSAFDAAPASTAARLAVLAHAMADLAAAAAREPFRRSLAPIPRTGRSLMIGSDIRAAWRSLRRQRTSTALVVGMLVLGIAANVVVFSLANGLLLRPFPFPSPTRLVFVNEKAPTWNLDVVGINYPDFWQWHEHTQAFESMAMFDGASFNLADDAGAEWVRGGRFTRDFPRVLGVDFIAGRTFSAEEDRPKGPSVVILSERLWRARFKAASDVVGKTIRVNGLSAEIVGVLPNIAEFPDRAALWVPYAGDKDATSQSYGSSGIGRLKPGVTVAMANEDLLRAHEPVWAAQDTKKVVSPFAKPLRDVLVDDAETTVMILLGGVVLLLLVACGNVSSVLLARAIARRREIGIRLAIGAGRGRLVRQLFVENLFLSAIAGVIGLLAGRALLTILVSALDTQVPSWAQFTMDARVAIFAVGLTLATALLFGWAPALHALRGNVNSTIQERTAGTIGSPGGRRTLAALVGVEFALAAILLVGGGLLFRAFDRVHRVNLGFGTSRTMTFGVSLPEATYEGQAKRLRFWDDLLVKLRAAPGVAAAGVVRCAPLDCHQGMFYKAEGQPPSKAGEPNPVVLTLAASEQYFETMNIGLAHGRAFELRDRQPNAEKVAVVNETFARRFWPGVDNPVGKHIGFNDTSTPMDMTVVGVVRDYKHYGPERPMLGAVFLPITERNSAYLTVAVKTTGDAAPESFATSARAIVTALDREIPIFRVRSMNDALVEKLRPRAVYSWMIGVLAMLALVLAIGGTYGVTAYLVSQRTKEIGIRMAIGARPADILRTVLRTGAAAILLGIAAGAVVAMILGGQLSDVLMEISPRDPFVISGVVLLLATAALAANWIPARRAARTDPSISLRA